MTGRALEVAFFLDTRLLYFYYFIILLAILVVLIMSVTGYRIVLESEK